MNFNHVAVACMVTLVGVAGCASDPGKKVNSAEAELTSDQRAARDSERDSNAEATEKHESGHAEAAGDKNAATTDAKNDVAVAKADLAQDRRDFNATTKERLAKIDAKAKELKTKSAKLTGKKATEFKSHEGVFNTHRTETSTKLSSLETSSNDGWESAKADVVKKLEHLEGALENMEKDL